MVGPLELLQLLLLVLLAALRRPDDGEASSSPADGNRPPSTEHIDRPLPCSRWGVAERDRQQWPRNDVDAPRGSEEVGLASGKNDALENEPVLGLPPLGITLRLSPARRATAMSAAISSSVERSAVVLVAPVTR